MDIQTEAATTSEASDQLTEALAATPGADDWQSTTRRDDEAQVYLIGSRVEAQRRVYSLRVEPLAGVDAWLGRYRALWEQRLDALHTEVERGKRERKRRSTR
jgi:hypothetical protein